ncbi:hypothetical protein H2248_003402 [Termitomyces sp. 'cryptogamus']|nr:hypothetical protein H2248_003402 [Termitomyces sp. 'cryptogamus']
MPASDTTTQSISAISICGADWKHDKFNRNLPTANFTKWSKALAIHLSLLGLRFYVFPPLATVHNTTTELVAYCNLVANDDLVHAAILTVLNEAEYEGLDKDKTAASLYTQVRPCAEVTAKQITDIVTHIFAIKELDKDLFKCVVLLNSLNSPQYKPFQTQILCGPADATKASPFKSENIWKLLKAIQNLQTLRTMGTGLATDTMLVATTQGWFWSTKPWLPENNHHAGVKCCHTCVE